MLAYSRQVRQVALSSSKVNTGPFQRRTLGVNVTLLGRTSELQIEYTRSCAAFEQLVNKNVPLVFASSVILKLS